jgi:hypothetical protein
MEVILKYTGAVEPLIPLQECQCDTYKEIDKERWCCSRLLSIVSCTLYSLRGPFIPKATKVALVATNDDVHENAVARLSRGRVQQLEGVTTY